MSLGYSFPEKPNAYNPKKHSLIWIDESWGMESKFDGWWCQLIKSGNKVRLRTGSNKEIDCPWLETHALNLAGDWRLVGELHAPGMKSTDVGHLLKHDPDKLQYAVFDVLHATLATVAIELDDVNLFGRQTFLPNDWINASNGRVFRSTMWITEEDKQANFQRIMDAGGEGVVFKNLNGTPCPGGRRNWLKVKPSDEFDVIAVAADQPPSHWTVEPGKYGTDAKLYPNGKVAAHWPAWERGEYVGLSYGYYLGPDGVLPKNAKEIMVPGVGRCANVGSLGWFGETSEMQALVGKVIRVNAWGRYDETGALRHPGAIGEHPDKRPEECILP